MPAAVKRVKQQLRTCYLWPGEVTQVAGELGASPREAATLSAAFDLEGFGGMECNPAFTAKQVVRVELTRLRALRGGLRRRG